MMFTIELSYANHTPAELALPSLTHKEFRGFCHQNPDLFVERSAEGKLIILAPTDAWGDSRNVAVTTDLGNWNRALPQPGLVFGPSAGFTLPNGAVRSPDAAWIPASKWNALTDDERDEFSQVCLNLVVELIFSSNELTRTLKKMDEYMANGALLGWLIDRKTKQVHVYRPHQKTQLLINPATVSGDPELPGFILPLARIF